MPGGVAGARLTAAPYADQCCRVVPVVAARMMLSVWHDMKAVVFMMFLITL